MRLFAALEISTELKGELERLEEELKNCRSLRFVKPDNIHLTLKFLGEVRDEKLEKVKAALSAIAFRGARLSTTRLGTFPGILWLGIRLTSELAQLQQEIERTVRPFALRDPRNYKPHLTLARFESLAPEERALIDSVVKEKRIEASWKVESFTLYRSMLTSAGPVYQALACFGPRSPPP